MYNTYLFCTHAWPASVLLFLSSTALCPVHLALVHRRLTRSFWTSLLAGSTRSLVPPPSTCMRAWARVIPSSMDAKGIILVCTTWALSCVCWVEADGPHVLSSDVPCQSSLTRWHLPRRRRLCAALITVTAGSQITKKSHSGINLLSQLAVNSKTRSRCARVRAPGFSGGMQWGVEARGETHTHKHTNAQRWKDYRIQTPTWLAW